MRGIAEIGAFAIFLIATVLMLSTFTMNSNAAPVGNEGGNWTNVSFSSYPTNHTNSSANETTFDFVLNGTMTYCIGEIGNATGYQNLTGTLSTTTSTNDTCTINVSFTEDSLVNTWFNVSVYVYNGTAYGGQTNMRTSNLTMFAVDTQTPTIALVGVPVNHNDTFNHYLYWNESVVLNQNYLNVSWTYTDNTSNTADNCKLEILWETINSTGASIKYSYANITANVTSKTAVTSLNRRIEVNVPATSITDGIYQGKFWVKPYCIDITGREGSTSTYSNAWGVVNPLPANTWTPLGVMYSTDTNLGNYSTYPLAYGGNISFIAKYQNDNSSFVTHQFNQTTYRTEGINISNESSVYVYPSTSWTLLRINATSLESPGNISIFYNDTGGVTRGNWRSFANYRGNTTKYILNTSSTCGAFFEYLAWFNSSDTRCAGGCWETYYNGWGINNETTIPFGTAYWLITNGSNATMTPASPLSVGTCGRP